MSPHASIPNQHSNIYCLLQILLDKHRVIIYTKNLDTPNYKYVLNGGIPDVQNTYHGLFRME